MARPAYPEAAAPLCLGLAYETNGWGTEMIETNDNSAIEEDEFTEYLGASADLYRFYSNVMLVELTAEQIEILAESDLSYPEDGSRTAEGYAWLRRYLARRGANARQDLAVDYARVFLGAGVDEKDAAVPYESVHRSETGLLMQEQRDEVYAFYRRFGFAVLEDLHVPEDHLGFELEFLGLMCERAAQAVGFDRDELLASMRTFIGEHVLSWLPQLVDKVDACAKRKFYPAMMRIIEGYVREQYEMLSELVGR